MTRMEESLLLQVWPLKGGREMRGNKAAVTLDGDVYILSDDTKQWVLVTTPELKQVIVDMFDFGALREMAERFKSKQEEEE